MDPEILNKNLISAIKEKLLYDKQTNIANELMDILSVGKEAIYRRLRNEVPFTFSEVALIAKKLGISIDTIVGTSLSKNISFELIQVRYADPEEIDYFRLKEYLEVLKAARESEDSELVYASNIFPQYPGFSYDYLTRFYSFKWWYQCVNASNMESYTESKLPEEFAKIRKEIVNETMNIKNTCYIWDSSILSSVVKDIKYFDSLGHLRDIDKKMLKEELNELVDGLESVAVKGMFKTGNKVQIYVCNTDFDATYCYLRTPRYKVSMIGAFSNYVNSLDDRAYDKLVSWTQSLKKLSTLISESGEIYRAQFFKKQRDVIKTLS